MEDTGIMKPGPREASDSSFEEDYNNVFLRNAKQFLSELRGEVLRIIVKPVIITQQYNIFLKFLHYERENVFMHDFTRQCSYLLLVCFWYFFILFLSCVLKRQINRRMSEHLFEKKVE